MNKKKIIIFKNDATGDLIHSREAIYNIINSNKDKEIILFLSKSSKEFSFLFHEKNLSIRFIKNKLSFAEKIKIFLLFFDKYIYKTFILTPKTFYFFLPFIFNAKRSPSSKLFNLFGENLYISPLSLSSVR